MTFNLLGLNVREQMSLSKEIQCYFLESLYVEEAMLVKSIDGPTDAGALS